MGQFYLSLIQLHHTYKLCLAPLKIPTCTVPVLSLITSYFLTCYCIQGSIHPSYFCPFHPPCKWAYLRLGKFKTIFKQLC